MAEYQGINIGSSRHRLDPTRKEVFIDVSEARAVGGDAQTAVEWAALKLANDLDIDTYYSEDISGLNIKGSTNRFPGSNPLRWRGSYREKAPTNGYIRVTVPLYGTLEKPDSPPTSGWSNGQFRRNAAVANFTTYYHNSVPISNDASCSGGCQPESSRKGMLLGQTDRDPNADSAFSVVGIFRGAVANIFATSVNSINEAIVNHRFVYQVSVERRCFGLTSCIGVFGFAAYFDSTDADDQGGITAANPFDLLYDTELHKGRRVTNNETIPNHVTGMTELDLLKRVSLHELGHAVGIWYPNADGVCKPNNGPGKVGLSVIEGHHDLDSCHPMDGISPMRGGIGPAKGDTFTPAEKAMMTLRREE